MYSLVKLIENGKQVDAVVATNWIRDRKVYWSNSINAKRDLLKCKEVQHGWPSYDLVKMKVQDDDYDLCNSFNFTSSEEKTPTKKKMAHKEKNVKMPTPPQHQKQRESTSIRNSAAENKRKYRFLEEDSSDSSPIKSAKINEGTPLSSPDYSASFRISPRAHSSLVTSPQQCTSSSTKASLTFSSAKKKKNGAQYNKEKYPLSDAEFQRKVLLGLSEIINLLKDNKQKENPGGFVERCHTEEELEELEERVRNSEEEYKNLVRQVSSIGGKNERECVKNILLTITTDEVLCLYSGKGLKGKKSFEKMKLFEVIIAGVLATKKSDREKIRKECNDVLKHAPARVKTCGRQ